MDYNERRNECKNMTLDDAEHEIINSVYMATGLFERLEGVGKLRGNGHHARQEAATLVANMLKERWIECKL